MRLAPLVPLVLASAAIGCPNTDPAVFVDAHVEAPSLQVESLALGTRVTGAFDLMLHLGARASDTSEVSVESFAVLSADQTTEILAPLQATTTTSFPVSVEQDSDETVHFTFDTGNTLLPADDKAAICGAGGLRIKAVIQDSLQGGAVPVISDVFQPSGC